MKNPPFLYHGSMDKNLKELEPRNESVRDKNEGPIVFATQELALATIFIAKEIVESGRFNNIPYAIIIGSRKKFIKNDNGGCIYVVSSKHFHNDRIEGFGKSEWVSKKKIKIKKIIKYPSVLEAMIQNGVQVYFVSNQIYKKIKKSKDYGFSILQKLESENQKTRTNIKLLQ